MTVQAKRNHVTTVSERMDPRHKPYYWIEEGENEWEPHDRSDYQAVRDGYISITPLQPDMTGGFCRLLERAAGVRWRWCAHLSGAGCDRRRCAPDSCANYPDLFDLEAPSG